MGPRSLVFGVGDGIRGWGRLVSDGDGDWFDPPLPVLTVAYLGGPPAPRRSDYAVPVQGADFDAVEHRYERDGAVEGYAMVDGLWLGDRISVHRQTTQRPDRSLPRWSDPPCEPPPGGWPHGMNGRYVDNLEFDLGALEDSGVVVSVVTFRPSDDQAVLVVAATDVPAVEAVLGPQLPNRLCVVPSRWTRAQLDDAQQHVLSMWAAWGVYQCGKGCDEQAQATVEVTLMRVTEEIADWVLGQPDGLIDLGPCLAPAHLDER